MLYLLVRLDGDTYALETTAVRRVLPHARLKAFPADLPAISGLLNHHGAPVVVLDLTRLVTNVASRDLLGTRIILVELTLSNDRPRLLGLLAEGVDSVVRLEPQSFQPAGARADGRPWLGPVIEHGGRLVQRIDPAALLPPEVLDALIHDATAALAA